MRLKPLKIWSHQKRLLVAVIEDEVSVIAAVRRLHRSGVKNDQISLLALDIEAVHDALHQVGHIPPPAMAKEQMVRQVDALTDELIPEGREELEGVTIGSCIGFLIGLSIFAIPGLGATLLAAGPVIMAVNVLGHTVGGGIGMGLVLGAVFDERVTEEHREYYRERLQNGHWLLIVHGDDAEIALARSEVAGAHVERVESF